MVRIYSIIPARAGSKGVPKKNGRLWGGYPLIAYSIIAAAMSKEIERVIVSTDSEEIADISRYYGAEVPFLRPAEISQDNSTDLELFQHAINWFQEKEGVIPDLLVHLRPTTPLRVPSEIDRATDYVKEHPAGTSLMSVHELAEPPQKMLQPDGNGFLRGFFPDDPRPEYYNLPRQTFPKAYHPNGYVDIIKPEFVQKTNTFHGPNMLGFVTSVATEVDLPEDFEYLEYQLVKYGNAICKRLLKIKTAENNKRERKYGKSKKKRKEKSCLVEREISSRKRSQIINLRFCFDGLSTVNVELTSRCNKNCWMCRRRKIDREYPEIALKYGDMDFELVRSIAAQIPDSIVVQLHDNGEPLLYPRFGEAARLFRRQIRCMDANGKLIVEKAGEIIENLDTLTISTFEGDEEGEEQYKLTKEFLKIKGDRKPKVVIRCLGKVDLDRYQELGCIIATRVLHSPLGSFEYKKSPTVPEIGICLDLLNHMAIKRDGKVSICVRFDPRRLGVIGDCTTTPLIDIWNGAQRREWLKYHIEGRRDKVPLCSYCQFWG